ncbi:MAG: histidine kinase dimerization/phospho-acceptor domain-containing protein, partial [Candidatus Mucispirillum faecigallinarum]|nr:histidine kinase dimerization/phospho-acceptor domain-containing protein [Candidatus Mucispirillum faecigallinarum]
MKKIFISEVIKYALIIGISVITLVWAALSRSTMATLERTLESYLQSSINIVNYDNSQHDIMLNEYKSSVLGTASNIALLIKADNSYLHDQIKLDELRRALKLDEIFVTDINMQVEASSPRSDNLSSSCVHVNEFVSGIYQNNFQKYLSPSFCDRYKEFMQYTGVSRIDKPGIVMIGRKSSNIKSVIKSSMLDNVSSIYSIYQNGFIAVIDKETHTIISYKDSKYLGLDISEIGIDIKELRSSMEVSKVQIEGKDAFALLRDSGKYSFIAIAFKKDVYFSVYVYIFIIMVSIALMVIFMQLFMLQVVNHHIINGISYVISCLNSITKDNLDTKVELNTCEEFSILSESINSMVSRLRNLLLSEKKLVQEKESLAAAKGDFLAMMSHEIRTPLNVIIGMAQLGMRSNFDDKQKRDTFADINVASTHLLSLLNDILDMSKTDAGKLELSNAPFSVLEDISHLQLLISAKAKEQELSLKVETEG